MSELAELLMFCEGVKTNLLHSSQKAELDNLMDRVQREHEALQKQVEGLRSEELLEQLADLEHDRWSRWMKYLFSNWTLPNIARWKQQMITPYSGLPEHSKESDRKEARKTLKVIEASTREAG